jgi:hypothetical protein
VVREHDALGIGRRSAGELQDRQPVAVVGHPHPAGGIRGRQLLDLQHGRIVGLGGDERRQLLVDQHELGVRAVDALAGLGHELLDRGEAHGQRQHDERGAGQPDGLDRGHERAGGGRQEGDVVPRLDALRLEGGGVALRVPVEVSPGDDLLGAPDDERDPAGVVAVGGALDASYERIHWRIGA